MFCPKCGQEQVSEALNFCSRCGFQLTEVTSLLARGGAPREIQENKPSNKKIRRNGLRVLLAMLAFFIVALISAANDVDEGVAIFGFLTVASFVIGSSLVISSWIKGRTRSGAEPGPRTNQTSRVEAPQGEALPPGFSPHVAMERARFDTDGIAQRPSVTEHTTRQLEQKRKRAHSLE